MNKTAASFAINAIKRDLVSPTESIKKEVSKRNLFHLLPLSDFK